MPALDGYVLIADDESLIATIVERVVISMGMNAVTVSDGSQTIQTAHALGRHLICVICDVVMPNTDGVQAAEVIRQSFPELPIILMSGSIPPALLQRSTLIPGVIFLQKPFRIRELRSLLTLLLPLLP